MSNPVQRAASRSAGKRPPPLPPPNKGMYDTLAEQLKGWFTVCSTFIDYLNSKEDCAYACHVITHMYNILRFSLSLECMGVHRYDGGGG